MIFLIFFSFIHLGFRDFQNLFHPTVLFLRGFLCLTTGLFKFNPLGYHLLAFFLRFVGVVLFYQILKEIWPNKKAFIFFASSIFAVYPGFLQQPIALIYCHHFSVLSNIPVLNFADDQGGKIRKDQWLRFRLINSWVVPYVLY